MTTPPPSDQDQEREIMTLLDLLTTDKIDGLSQTTIRSSNGSRWRRTLRERLGFITCCAAAATWRDHPDTHDQNGVVLVEEIQQEDEEEAESRASAAARGMNLAAALAAERELRPPRTPLRRLLEAEKREKEERENEEMEMGISSDSVCCVCMGRKKGAAMIPCGHTYCRVCSREIWLTRGSCPLCNRPILEILDIF